MVRLVLLVIPPITSAASTVQSTGCPSVGGIQAEGSFHSHQDDSMDEYIS